jgi:hypothetical protein
MRKKIGEAFGTHGIKTIRSVLVKNPERKRPLARPNPKWDEYIEKYFK